MDYRSKLIIVQCAEKRFLIDLVKAEYGKGEIIMKVNNYDVTFVTDTYADMFQRKAVLAFVVDKNRCEPYGIVTINIPQYSLEEGESFLSNDCPDLLNAMVKNGYLKITDSVKVNLATYKVGRFTQKFINEFEKGSVTRI